MRNARGAVFASTNDGPVAIDIDLGAKQFSIGDIGSSQFPARDRQRHRAEPKRPEHEAVAAQCQRCLGGRFIGGCVDRGVQRQRQAVVRSCTTADPHEVRIRAAIGRDVDEVPDKPIDGNCPQTGSQQSCILVGQIEISGAWGEIRYGQRHRLTVVELEAVPIPVAFGRSQHGAALDGDTGHREETRLEILRRADDVVGRFAMRLLFQRGVENDPRGTESD